MYPQNENLLLESLVKGELKIKESGSKTYLEMRQSQSSESINEDPTASQSDLVPPEFVAQLLTKVRALKRKLASYQQPQYPSSNTVEIKIWAQGFIIIKTAEQEITICNYGCDPDGAAHYTVVLSSLDASKIINKIKDPSILGRHWYNFGKDHFRAKNGKANAAALAYAILDSAGIDKILAFSCYEVDAKNIHMATLIRILSITKQTEDEDLSQPPVHLEPVPQKKRSIDDAIFNIVLICIINQGIIEEPKLSQPRWELTARHEDLQCFLNLNYEKVNSAELKDWFDENYNSKSGETDKQKSIILERRNELIKLINDIQEKKRQTVEETVRHSANTNIQSDDSKTHKHRKCLVM